MSDRLAGIRNWNRNEDVSDRARGPGTGGLLESRPALAHLVLFYAASILAGGLGQGLAIIPGVSITFWPAVGILIAILLLNPRSTWPWWILFGGLAELTCNELWFHNPVFFALIYYAGNALESVTAALLLAWLVPRPFRLESLEEVAAFVAVGAGIAPTVSATVIALTDALRGKHPFATAWPLVWLGDGTGVLVSAPLTLVAVLVWRERANIPLGRLLEAALVGLLLLGGCLLAFQGFLPTVYVILPLIVWASARFQVRGAAVALGIVTLTAAAFTMRGRGEFAGAPELLHEKIVMLQTFLGVSAVSALVVGALSLLHQQALRSVQAANANLEARVAERTAELRESEERLRRANRAGGTGIWEWSLYDGDAYWSPEACTLFGHPLDCEVDFDLWVNSLHPDDRARARDNVSRAIEQAQADGHSFYQDEFRVLHASGATLWLASTGVIEGSAARLTMRGVVQDVTARKRAEEALRDADRRKDEFLATLSHELRNPLSPVRSAVQILRMKVSEVPELQKAAALIDRQVQVMTRLIDDLLDVSRISRGKIELRREPVELAQVIQRAVETSRPLIEAMGHQLQVTLPPQPVLVDADLTRLAQVFQNLLNNAAKYMERGGRIEVSAELRDRGVAVSVRDWGIGIHADQAASLFEMFSQLEGALSRSQGGLGIGLYLVKQLVELHAGQVEARSAGLGQGSEFVVRLPTLAERSSSPEDAADQRAPASGLRILVVDDNRDAADSLATYLEILGNHVHVTYDGETALDAAEEFRPHVVLCDIGLPKLNGYEVCRRIRQEPWGRDMILVAATGWGQDGDKREAREAGFDHHLVKPIDPQALSSWLGALSVAEAGSTRPVRGSGFFSAT